MRFRIPPRPHLSPELTQREQGEDVRFGLEADSSVREALVTQGLV